MVVPVEERLEGQRAWIAQIERKLAVRTYAGAAAIVLALAAGIVGTVLALGAKDESATKTEVQALSDRLSNSQKETANAAQEDLSSSSPIASTRSRAASTRSPPTSAPRIAS